MTDVETCEKCALGNLAYNIQYGKAKAIGTKFNVMFVLQNPKLNKTDLSEVQMLKDVFNEVGIIEEDVGIVYLVKCSNIDNSPPGPDVIYQCANEHLEKEIEKNKPKIIVAVGKVVSDYFGVRLGGSGRYKLARVFAVYSPNAAKYNPDMKNKIEQMYKWVKTEIYNAKTIDKWAE